MTHVRKPSQAYLPRRSGKMGLRIVIAWASSVFSTGADHLPIYPQGSGPILHLSVTCYYLANWW